MTTMHKRKVLVHNRKTAYIMSLLFIKNKFYNDDVNGAPKTGVLKNGLITLKKLHHQMQKTRNNCFGLKKKT